MDGRMFPVSPACSRHWLRGNHGFLHHKMAGALVTPIAMDEGAHAQFLCSRSGGDMMSCFRPLHMPVIHWHSPSSFFAGRGDVCTPVPGRDRLQAILWLSVFFLVVPWFYLAFSFILFFSLTVLLCICLPKGWFPFSSPYVILFYSILFVSLWRLCFIFRNDVFDK